MGKLVKYGGECSRCGAAIPVTGADIGDTGFIAWRKECKSCGAVNYFTFKAPRGRIRQDSVDLHIAIHDVMADIAPPMTVRQVYYQLTTRKAVDKTDAGYDRVQRALADMRRNGSIPYSWIADNSRTFFQAPTHQDLTTALGEMQQYYRHDLWAAQPLHVEVWLEKRSLVSQLQPVCSEFGVRLYPCGGYSSISFAYEAAMELCEIDKPIYVYHLSDLDADGAYSSVALERELREHGASFHFRRLALTPDQVVTWGLQAATREQKRTSTRWGWWAERYGAAQPACELDAIHPQQLRQLVHNAITQHIDPYEWDRLRSIERQERESLQMVRAALAGGAL